MLRTMLGLFVILYFTFTASAASTPTNLRVLSVNSTVNLAWNDVGDETGYSIESCATENGPFAPIGTTGQNVTTYGAPLPASGTTVYFRVRATDAIGSSAQSNLVGQGIPAAGAQVLMTQYATAPVPEYWLWLPPGYSTAQNWPVLVFMHGAGEIGGLPSMAKVHGPPKLVTQSDPNLAVLRQNFIVVGLHMSVDGNWWDDTRRPIVNNIAQQITQNFAGDPERIYVSGLSRGGRGAIGIYSKQSSNPAQRIYAACLETCGFKDGIVDPAGYETMKNWPIWLHHGTADGTVAYSESQYIANRIEQLGGATFLRHERNAWSPSYLSNGHIFTTYTNYGHDVWTETFNNPNVYYWLLQYAKSPPQILSQPTAATIRHGEPLELTVGASGYNLTYQWYRDGQPVSGATGANYSVPAANFANAGLYHVVVSSASASVTSNTVAVAVQVNIHSVTYLQQSNPAPVYGKAEFVVDVATKVNGSKVYDPDPATGGIRLNGYFFDGSQTLIVPGFFDGSTNQWRVRFSPPHAANWQAAFQAWDSTGSVDSPYTYFSVALAVNNGFAKLNGGYLYFADGQMLRAVGPNNGWQYEVRQPGFDVMQAQNINLMSFWMSSPWILANESDPTLARRTPLENVTQGVGNYNQNAAAYIDTVVSDAEAHGIFLIPSIWSHGEARQDGTHGWGDGYWENNAYSTICSAVDFFKVTTEAGGSIKTPQWIAQEKRLRYILARWGYSRAIVSFVGMVEIDGTTGFLGSSGNNNTVTWRTEFAKYMRDNDPYRTNAQGNPFTISHTNYSSGQAPIPAAWDNSCNVRCMDSYTTKQSNFAEYTLVSNVGGQTKQMRDSGKPAYVAEFGLHNHTQAETRAKSVLALHNGIWAGWMAGGMVAPLPWCDGGYWPLLNDATYGVDLRANMTRLSAFLSNSFDLNAPVRVTTTITNGNAFALKDGNKAVGWVHETSPTTTINGKAFTLSHPSAYYRVEWHDPWEPGVPVVAVSRTYLSGPTIALAVPFGPFSRNDAVFRLLPNHAPTVAASTSVTTAEDTPVTIPLNASDADNDPLVFTVTQPPVHGTLSGNAGTYQYTPTLNYFGSDSFTVLVDDGLQSVTHVVSITVTPVSDSPVAADQFETVNEDTPKQIVFNASDAETHPLEITIFNLPDHGTLSPFPLWEPAESIQYTPNPGYSGPDFFTYMAFDGENFTDMAVVYITVTAVNDAPVANSTPLSLYEDQPTSFVLNANDEEGSPLNAEVLTQPLHGTVTVEGLNALYTPAANYFGADSFTFRVSDGTQISNTATVSILVDAVDDSPTSQNLDVFVQEDGTIQIFFPVNDVDSSTFTFHLHDLPRFGSFAGQNGSTPNMTYTPNPNFFGPEFLEFRIGDGTTFSSFYQLNINVVPVNDPPVLASTTEFAVEDAVGYFMLNVTDVESRDPYAFTAEVITPPAHGTVSFDGIFGAYTPVTNFAGFDSFQVRVSDGQDFSETATIVFEVDPVNDAPFANAQAVSVNEDTWRRIVLDAGDVDSLFSIEIITPPAHGTLVIPFAQPSNSGVIDYTPAADYVGVDSFSYRINDGSLASNTVTVSLIVSGGNDAPVLVGPGNRTVTEDTTLVFTLNANDPDGDPLTAQILVAPTNGTLTFNGLTGTYTPTIQNSGTDFFSVHVSDGQLTSASADSAITIVDVNDAPTAENQSVSTDRNQVLALTLTGADIENNPLTFQVLQAPSHGTLSGGAPNLTYTPALHYVGADSFTFQVSDGALTAQGAISINVLAFNRAPVAQALAVSTLEDAANGIVLAGMDLDNDPLTFTVLTQPTKGTLSGVAPHLTYTPAANVTGADSFTYRVHDGFVASSAATVSITISPVNDAPQIISGPTVTPAFATTGQTITFFASATDVEGSTLTYSWNFNGTVKTGASVTHSYASAGTYTVVLTVSDGSATVQVSVQVSVVAPTTVSFQQQVSPTTSYSGTTDTWLNTSSKNQNNGTAATVNVRGNAANYALLRWNTSTIPANAVVLSAEIVLNVTDGSSAAYSIYELKRTWNETQATWNIAQTGTNWQTAGALGANDRATTVLATTPSGTGSKTIALNTAGVATVQKWINNSANNFGVTFQGTSSMTDLFRFSSRSTTTKTQRPKLTVRYIIPPASGAASR